MLIKISRIILRRVSITRRFASSYSTEEREKYSDERETHFGFDTVTEKEKAEKVKAVFENVASQYDVMNDCMSMGVHRIWKDIFVDRLKPGSDTKLIDVAGGTGDIAFRFLKYQKTYPNFKRRLPILPLQDMPTATKLAQNEVEAQYQAMKDSEKDSEEQEKETDGLSVLVCDINPKMLQVGKQRSTKNLNHIQNKRIEWMEGDAENLHLIPDSSFDVYTIAFGIRNCVHIDEVLNEAYRVLKPGGRFLCLEFSHVKNPLVKWAYDQYSFQIIPPMGQVIAGDWESYMYLVQSIRKFPTQEHFKTMIQEAGFRFVTYENLTLGVAAIHSGFKL